MTQLARAEGENEMMAVMGEARTMAKLARSAEELRIVILAEAARQPVCPRGIDVAIRHDPQFGWRADIISANQIGYADCAQAIGSIVQQLRRDYELKAKSPTRVLPSKAARSCW